ncbi:Phospholipase YtpA [Salinivirga cyanobacteriivorans]|uniref:Phospholipase YtpA n=1 Tax=Salinivirga cyanobacteriivorans TaxID=1307839 RepID=A0A0S2I137_9BACT|nr:alpha/beta hydrolase [Salinivirga cyanobacteriivorans]ALO16013.1 Phospholipase YtpA [Salinivirga cyanobacteriivorans]
MKVEEYQWKVNNKNVYGATWLPEKSPQAVIIFIHGIGEHIHRYDSWFEIFIEIDMAVISADHHGHGRSEGKRGHFKNYCEPMDFTAMLFDKADKLFPHLPKILYGHSMGGNIALNFLIRKRPKVKSAIISAPWVKLNKPPKKWLVNLARIFRPVWPAFSLKAGIKRSELTTNEEELEKYEKDELVHGRITISSFLELDAAARYINENIQSLSIPTLILQGESDPIASLNGPKKLKGKNPHYIEIKTFEGFLHEIHKEKERQIAFNEIQQWLSRTV